MDNYKEEQKKTRDALKPRLLSIEEMPISLLEQNFKLTSKNRKYNRNIKYTKDRLMTKKGYKNGLKV